MAKDLKRYGRRGREGFARSKVGIFETLEARRPLAGDLQHDHDVDDHNEPIRDAYGEYFFHPVESAEFADSTSTSAPIVNAATASVDIDDVPI